MRVPTLDGEVMATSHWAQPHPFTIDLRTADLG